MIIFIILILILLGGVGGPYLGASWGPGYGGGLPVNGGIGLLLVVLVVLALAGYL